jgi:hypothetical protein
MVGVAAIAGPLNYLLASVLYVLALTQAPRGPGEAPLLFLSQLLAALGTISFCVLMVKRLSSLPAAWGYLLGMAIALLTNPVVMVNLLSWLLGEG